MEEALHALATGLARFGCRGAAPSRVGIAEIAGLRTTDPSGIPVSLIAQLGPALSVWWCVLRSCDLQVPPHDLAVFFSYLLHERAPGVVAGLPVAALDRLRRGDFATYGHS